LSASVVRKLKVVHAELAACSACPSMIGPVVHGPPVPSRVLLLGQAPGPHEGKFGRPFAWTAGKTMFRWFEESVGIDEETFRAKIYMAAVARCFPGKSKGGGDRKPDPGEIERCGRFLGREVEILAPELVLAVGTMAIYEVLGEAAKKKKLDELVGTATRVTWLGRELDVVPLPHPSGASPWHRIEPGKTLLQKALRLVAKHPAMRAAITS
jgi:uracil-DNA glycosylase